MPKLAVHGGDKAVPERHVEWPMVSETDKRAVMAVMERRIFFDAFAPEVKALQEEWAKYVGTKHALVTNSGTSALHIAVAAAGVGPGDEVITSAMTYVATAHAIMHQNGIPVFVDIAPKTYNIDPGKIEARITERTKAIIPVHLHGLPADMDEINAIAKKHNVIVIEDACQAHGATYKGKKAGNLADMAGFSFNGSKNLPGGEGGVFTTNSDEFKRRANLVRVLGEALEEGVERDYDAFEIGWMYRTQEMIAAYVRCRLRTLDQENGVRVENAAYLTKHLGALPGIIPPYVPSDRTTVHHLYRLRFDPKPLGLNVSPKEFRAKVQKALRAEGVQAQRWQNRPVPMQTLFQERKGYGEGCPWMCPFGNQARQAPERLDDYPETKKLVDDSFVMHSAIYPPNGQPLLENYVEAFRKLWDNLDEVMDVAFEPGEIYLRD